ncbi:TPA: crAss001_48 related protein [Salmonella enterica]
MENEDVINALKEESAAVEAKVKTIREMRGTEEFNNLPIKQQGLLMMQLNAMELYADILNLRIDDLGLNIE